MTSFRAAKGTFTVAGSLELESVGGLGFEPVAVIAWWSRQGRHGMARGNHGGIGLWAANECAAVAWASEDAVPTTRIGQVAESAALVGLAGADAGIELRAELDSFDADGFTLHFETRPPGPWTVHYLALGGPAVISSVGWTSPRVLPGPSDLLVVVHAEPGMIGIGAAAGRRRAAAGYSPRGGAAPGAVTGWQRDALNIGVASGDRLWPYLLLEGVRAVVNSDSSPDVPTSKRTRVGFRPEALLLFSWGLPRSKRPKGIGRLCLGGVSGDVSGCVSWDDRNTYDVETSSHVHSSVRHALVVTDTRTGGLHAEATLASVDDTGFTLRWASDGQPREFAYVALADAEPARTTPGLAERLRRG